MLIKCLLGNYFAGKSLSSATARRTVNGRWWRWSQSSFEMGSEEDEFMRERERRRRDYDYYSR